MSSGKHYRLYGGNHLAIEGQQITDRLVLGSSNRGEAAVLGFMSDVHSERLSPIAAYKLSMELLKMCNQWADEGRLVHFTRRGKPMIKEVPPKA